jgi:DNA-binding CsgD family transcriptional regulator
MTTLSVTAARAREELVVRAASADDVMGVFRTASERLRRLVPFDAAVWLATDPATQLPTAPTRSENMEERARVNREECVRVWEREFLMEDVNLYGELTRAEIPAGGLRATTDDLPRRSPRYRSLLRAKGFADELRAVMRVDGSPWAFVSLFRDEGRPAFEQREVELVATLSRPLGQAVRDHTRSSSHTDRTGEQRGPGLMLFAPSGELISANDDARRWLDELPHDPVESADFGGPLPMVLVAALMRARAITAEHDNGSARARVRSTAGRWLVCHASCLRDADGRIGNTALVLEPAKASEMAPIIVKAYQLLPREQQITQLIAQGLRTADIASRLFLSPHTVRGYVKAIFEKVGVTSRGELVAKLFAEHYAPVHLDPSAFESVGD